MTLPDAEPADRAPPMCVPFTALQLHPCRTGWPPRVSDFTADGLLFKLSVIFFADKVNFGGSVVYLVLIRRCTYYLYGVRRYSLKDGSSVVLVLQSRMLRRFWMMNLET